MKRQARKRDKTRSISTNEIMSSYPIDHINSHAYLYRPVASKAIEMSLQDTAQNLKQMGIEKRFAVRKVSPKVTLASAYLLESILRQHNNPAEFIQAMRNIDELSMKLDTIATPQYLRYLGKHLAVGITYPEQSGELKAVWNTIVTNAPAEYSSRRQNTNLHITIAVSHPPHRIDNETLDSVYEQHLKDLSIPLAPTVLSQ